eukprot:g22203.t1
MSRSNLQDSQLGDDGRTYFVDAFGTILSAMDIQETKFPLLTVHLQETLGVDLNGNMQFRQITQLPTDWSSSIAPAFQGDHIQAMQVQQGWLADTSIIQSMIVLMAFASVPYVVVFVTLSIVFMSANNQGQFQLRKTYLARLANGVTDFAAARGVRMPNRMTMRKAPSVVSGNVDGPLFTKEWEGERSEGEGMNGQSCIGRKISQASVISAAEIYEDGAGDRPLAVQPRKTHIVNDAYFEADKSCKGYFVRCVRCLCICCRR